MRCEDRRDRSGTREFLRRRFAAADGEGRGIILGAIVHDCAAGVLQAVCPTGTDVPESGVDGADGLQRERRLHDFGIME
ncbi:hypothetical protein CO675_12745 [Bradyrhizobium sp. C9]|nr:hypothetical protein CO675_12745 [Bradyrhizobium sp. C9]